jgi:hypothetical protein
VPTEMLSKNEHRTSETLPPTAVTMEKHDRRTAARRQVKRVRWLKINAVAWLAGAILITTIWVVNEWQANGAFESFGHEGEAGQWNPTLWALAIGIWGLVVAIMALRVHFQRPPTEPEVDRELERLTPQPTETDAPTDAEFRRFARARLERIRRLRFHVAGWVLGMVVLTPLWALIEWQDNGGFERFGSESQPGEWEPWILYVGGIWALVIAIFALTTYRERPPTKAEIDRELERLGGNV